MTATVPRADTRFSDGRRIVLDENERLLNSIAADQWDRAGSLITNARAVFVIGNGRSGLATQMAAMRLMHLGLRVHVAGEVTAPAIGRRSSDRRVGSGTTASVVGAADTARKVGPRCSPSPRPRNRRSPNAPTRFWSCRGRQTGPQRVGHPSVRRQPVRAVRALAFDACSKRCGATRTRPPSGCGNATPTSADPAHRKPRMAHR
jgi:hypothetical protein